MAFKVLFALSALVAVGQAHVAISQANQVQGRGAERLGISLHGIGIENLDHALKFVGGPEVGVPPDPRLRSRIHSIRGLGDDRLGLYDIRGLDRDRLGLYDIRGLDRDRLGLYGGLRHEKDEYPLYAYKYAVKDSKTGDIKTQKEVRDGHIVRGEINQVEADGSPRRVFYVSEGDEGFGVIVQRGPNIHPY